MGNYNMVSSKFIGQVQQDALLSPSVSEPSFLLENLVPVQSQFLVYLPRDHCILRFNVNSEVIACE
jgi:hypothetical protein